MQERRTWAYCDVRPDGTITYYGVADDHRTQARPNVHAVDTERWAEEAVAWLGLQGWELIGVVHGEGRTFYFRRPIDARTETFEGEDVAAAGAGTTPPEVGVVAGEEPDAAGIDPVRLIEEEFLPE